MLSAHHHCRDNHRNVFLFCCPCYPLDDHVFLKCSVLAFPHAYAWPSSVLKWTLSQQCHDGGAKFYVYCRHINSPHRQQQKNSYKIHCYRFSLLHYADNLVRLSIEKTKGCRWVQWFYIVNFIALFALREHFTFYRRETCPRMYVYYT